MSFLLRFVALSLFLINGSVTCRLIADSLYALPPTLSDLREEERFVVLFQLVPAKEFLKGAREKWAHEQIGAAKENTFHALEMLTRAKVILDKLPERIERTSGDMFSSDRAKDLRQSLREAIDPQYFGLLTEIEDLATQFAQAGDHSVLATLGAAKKGELENVLALMDEGHVTKVELRGFESMVHSMNSAYSGRFSGSSEGAQGLTGRVPRAASFVDENGSRIEVDPIWDRGEQQYVRREYFGGDGAGLLCETRRRRKIVKIDQPRYTVSAASLEIRFWIFDLKISDQPRGAEPGTLSCVLDAKAQPGKYIVKNWSAMSTNGAQAKITAISEKSARVIATLSKDARYRITSFAETEWGSPFEVTVETDAHP